jgi:hypothetical protein
LRTRHPFLLSLSLLVVLGATGCTRHLTPTVRLDDLPVATPRPLKVALVLPEAMRSRTDTYGSFYTLGSGNTWVCDTGEALTPALERVARSAFRDVRVVSSVQEAGDAELRLEPEVAELRQMSEREGFWISFKLRAVAQDGSGARWLDKTYAEVEEGSTGAAVWGGAFGVTGALLTPTERAMERALKQLARDLREARAAPPRS